MSARLERSWQKRSWLACLLWPLSVLYAAAVNLRGFAYRRGWQRPKPASLPVIVVGNLSVGGTGKTPLCAFLVQRFAQAGWTPAIVSRGYGGQKHRRPHLLSAADTASTAGDEPVMLFAQTGVPVCVCIDRAAAVEHIAELTDADIVFSDDGLQHLRMARVAEIVVIDGARGLGNRWLLPAGPLRESMQRLVSSVSAAVQLIAIQVPFTGVDEVSDAMSDVLHASLTRHQGAALLEASIRQCFMLVPSQLVALSGGNTSDLRSWRGQRVHAVAGIGNPHRFFDSLLASGLIVEPHAMPDHHHYALTDLAFADDAPILVTSKDAVKLRTLAELPVSVHEVCTRLQPSAELAAAIDRLERSLRARFHEHDSMNRESKVVRNVQST